MYGCVEKGCEENGCDVGFIDGDFGFLEIDGLIGGGFFWLLNYCNKDGGWGDID